MGVTRKKKAWKGKKEKDPRALFIRKKGHRTGARIEELDTAEWARLSP